MPTREQLARSKRRKELGLAWCSSCKNDKPQAGFNPCPGRRPFGLSSHCKGCDLRRKTDQKYRNYWALDKAGRMAFNRKARIRKFGITVEDYDRMLESQRGVCAICSESEVVEHHSTGEVQPLTIDHDHATGVVRGLLCTRCNKGIGLLRDNASYLRAAADYIERFEAHTFLVEAHGEFKLINHAGVAHQ